MKICRNSNWGNKEEELVCHELDCGIPDKNAVRPNFGGGPDGNGYRTNCAGAESSIAECPLQFKPTACESVAVVCSGKIVC